MGGRLCGKRKNNVTTLNQYLTVADGKPCELHSRTSRPSALDIECWLLDIELRY